MSMAYFAAIFVSMIMKMSVSKAENTPMMMHLHML